MLSNVVAVVWDGAAPFELGVICEVFGIDRSDEGLPVIDFDVCSVRAGRVATSTGFDLHVKHGIERAGRADLIAVSAHAAPRPDGGGRPAIGRVGEGRSTTPPAVVTALREAVARGARVMSVCGGAFALGEAGLLDGRRCTTHWRHTDELAQRFPRAVVDPYVLYVDEDPVITSAGTAAGIDASLHLVRKEFGAGAAAQIARRMVVPPHRDGGQAQFVTAPITEDSGATLTPLLEWARRHLDEDLSVPVLARRAAMSPRTFARHFREETGTTPHRWVLSERLRLAEHLLETTDAPVEQVSRRAGFGPASALRHHFVRARRTTPSGYRTAFRGTGDQQRRREAGLGATAR